MLGHNPRKTGQGHYDKKKGEKILMGGVRWESLYNAVVLCALSRRGTDQQPTRLMVVVGKMGDGKRSSKTLYDPLNDVTRVGVDGQSGLVSVIVGKKGGPERKRGNVLLCSRNTIPWILSDKREGNTSRDWC